MSFREALHRALTGRSTWGERGLRRPMRDLERRYGSQAAAAEAVGVNKGTWWRWRTGRSKPKPESVQRIRAARRRAVVDEPATRRLISLSTAGPQEGPGGITGGLTVQGWVTVSSDSRPRTLYIGPYLGMGRLDRMADAWFAGDDATVEAEIAEAVNDYVRSNNGPGATIENPVFNFGFVAPDDDGPDGQGEAE